MDSVHGIPRKDWNTLCRRVASGRCVPVVGARLFSDVFPLREELARTWAEEIDYPLADTGDLAMVAEYARFSEASDDPSLRELFRDFVELNADEIVRRRMAANNGQSAPQPQRSPLSLPDGHPLRTLVELPFTVFVTTSCEDLLEDALRTYRPKSTPIPAFCNRDERIDVDLADDSGSVAMPTFEAPVVFHLHGRIQEEASLVLTETDHMALTTDLGARDSSGALSRGLLPSPVMDALGESAWFFVGYSAADRNLRGLLRAMAALVVNERQAVAVQLEKGDTAPGRAAAADDFLTWYFGRLLRREVEVVLDDVGSFLGDLKVAVDQQLTSRPVATSGRA